MAAGIFLPKAKTCPRCGYLIGDPGTLRCPRCYKSLLKPACCGGNCRACGNGRESVSGDCPGHGKTRTSRAD